MQPKMIILMECMLESCSAVLSAVIQAWSLQGLPELGIQLSIPIHTVSYMMTSTPRMPYLHCITMLQKGIKDPMDSARLGMLSPTNSSWRPFQS